MTLEEDLTELAKKHGFKEYAFISARADKKGLDIETVGTDRLCDFIIGAIDGHKAAVEYMAKKNIQRRIIE